jgi:hypothetical protein
MNCQEFELIVIDLARNRLVEATTSEQSMVHSETCAHCRARLAEERALITGVRAVIGEIANEGAPLHIEAALLEAFRERATTRAAPAVFPTRIETGHRPRWIFGFAAVVILALVSLTAIFWRQSDSLNQKQEAGSTAPGPSIPRAERPEPAPEREPPSTDDACASAHKQITPRHQRLRRGGARLNSSNENEVTTPFFSLRDGDDFDISEGGQVVRVELPGSALIAVGLPIDAVMASEPVKADVVLGYDGLARAIRFVK